MKYACDQLSSEMQDERYEAKDKTCALSAIQYFECVRLDRSYLDYGGSHNPASQPLALENHLLLCRHPDFYNALIALNYSQTSPQGYTQKDVDQQADDFFGGIGMNSPMKGKSKGFQYESSSEIGQSKPGTNLAAHKSIKVSRMLGDFPASFAVDGNLRNWWGAGARPPQWIEIDLGGNYVIDEIRMLTSQSPTGRTIHHVLGRGPATQHEFQVLHIFDQETRDNERLTFDGLETLEGIRYIRIETPYSPSWVSWREIEVIAGAKQ